MTAKYENPSFFKRLFRFMFILIFVLGAVQFLPGFISGRSNQASAASDPVIAAAGDIACDPANSHFNSGNGTSNSCRQKYTSNLLVNTGLTAVLALGDNQYYCGSFDAFMQSYDLSWGQIKSITHPSVGNHEYLTHGGTSGATGCDATNSNAAGYFQYYGSAAGSPTQGYYSFDVGTWHLIALNTNCGSVGGCGTSSPQYKWLQSDLAAHTNLCTLAFWHIPLYSSGGRANANSQQFWNLLYNNNADLILSGHDHIYERFAPQNPSAQLDTTRGIREFIVGTGGSDHTTIVSIAANSEVRNTDTFGVLRLTLHPSSYDWQFVPEAGKTFTDSGTTACHGTAPAATATPTLTATLSNTNTPTPTSAGTNTPTPTPVVSNTPTSTLAMTNTPTPTSAATNTPTPTPAMTNTPTPTPAVTNTPTTTSTPTPTPTATVSSGQSFMFNPVADAYVDSSNPTVNNGTGLTIRVDGSPIVNTYIRFNVSGLVGTVTRVRLLIFANSSGSLGIKANAVADNTWGETTINYNNAPPMGSQLASSAGFSSGTWVTLDVTGYITADGTYSFGITDPSSTAISLASRESGANAEQLIIDTQ